MIYNIITSTPKILTYLINEKITKEAFKIKIIKLNIYNKKKKKKKKIQK